MDSHTSPAHDSSDEREQMLEGATIEALDALAAAPADARALGSAVLLSGTPKPPRAIPGNPPRSGQKNRDQARSGPERTEKR